MTDMNPSGGASGLIHPETPPKDPILVLVLNLLILGGVGSIILGQKTKGIVAMVIALAIGIPTCGVATLLVALFGAIDGYMQAEQLKQGHPIGQWTFFNDHR
jgi:hypothetical protein